MSTVKKMSSLENIVKKYEHLTSNPSIKAIRDWKRPNCAEITNERKVYESVQKADDKTFFERTLNIVKSKIPQE